MRIFVLCTVYLFYFSSVFYDKKDGCILFATQIWIHQKKENLVLQWEPCFRMRTGHPKKGSCFRQHTQPQTPQDILGLKTPHTLDPESPRNTLDLNTPYTLSSGNPIHKIDFQPTPTHTRLQKPHTHTRFPTHTHTWPQELADTPNLRHLEPTRSQNPTHTRSRKPKEFWRLGVC